MRWKPAPWPLPCVLLVCVSWAAAVRAADLDAAIAVEMRHFPSQGLNGQDRGAFSGSAQVEMVLEKGDSSRLVVTPFVRVDSDDDKRSHADLRELFLSTLGDDWELSVGFKQEFWGVVEFAHLVDIINQTDLVENIDGEDKLGQPMIQLSLLRTWGTLDLFALTGFRERTFPGRNGRLALPFEIDTHGARYASSKRQRRIDLAVRWSHQIGGLDIGLSQFHGTGRSPDFLLEQRQGGALPVLVPEYPVIDQTGVDAQYLRGNWAFKLEALSRGGQGERFVATATGLEYTIVGVFGTTVDLGLVGEYFHDERGKEAFDTLFQDDVAVGLRFGFNDANDSQLLLGVVRDTTSRETVMSVEGSRRIGDHLTVSVEARTFGGSHHLVRDAPQSWLADRGHAGAFLQNEDYAQVELKWFF